MRDLVLVWVIISLVMASAFAEKADADESLVLYLTFDDGKGDAAKDLSQYDNHGALVGGPKWVKGKFNGALELDGVDDYVVVEKSDSLKFGRGSFSVEAWVNLSAEQTTGGPGGRLANDRGTGAGGTLHGWQIKINNTGDGNKKWGRSCCLSLWQTHDNVGDNQESLSAFRVPKSIKNIVEPKKENSQCNFCYAEKSPLKMG